ncbi:MAG: exonuclease subunit SbcD [Flavobacteriales bacterium]
MTELKILHTADWHLGKRLSEYSRIDEQREVMNEMVQIANAQSLDLVIVAGDLFDLFQPSHEAQELLYHTLYQLCDNGKRPVVAIAGNHDSHALIEAPMPLAKELGILLLGANHSSQEKIVNASGIEISIPENGIVKIHFPKKDEDVNIIVAPYANEQLLKIYLGEENREDELRKILSDRWQTIAEKYFSKSSFNLFVGHFFFMKQGNTPEVEPEGERSILHVGGAQAIYSDDLPNTLHYAALGHLHRFHYVDKTRFPVAYSGSPLQYSFSEAGQKKYCLLLRWEDQLHIEELELNEGFDLHRVTFEDHGEAIQWLESNPNTYVELTYISDKVLDAQLRKALLNAHPRIVHLIPKMKNVNQDASKSIQADDLAENFETLFKKYFENEKGQEASDELLKLLQEVVSKGGGE